MGEIPWFFLSMIAMVSAHSPSKHLLFCWRVPVLGWSRGCKKGQSHVRCAIFFKNLLAFSAICTPMDNQNMSVASWLMTFGETTSEKPNTNVTRTSLSCLWQSCWVFLNQKVLHWSTHSTNWTEKNWSAVKSSTSRFDEHAGFFRLFLTETFDVCLQWPLSKSWFSNCKHAFVHCK